MTFRSFLFTCIFGAAAVCGLRAQEALPPTVIEFAGPAEMVSTDTETIATFHDKVVVTGNNIKVTCDYLKVVASRKGDPKATIGKFGYFKSLVATGHVKIVQGDREASCGHAEIFPGEDRVVLSRLTKSKDEPFPTVRSIDDQYVASGPRLVLYRGERRALIEAEDGAAVGVTGRFVLPTIKDMGFAKDKPAEKSSPPRLP
jgi:hypothetical protein